MKRCPTCQRTFEDDSLSYCLDDGTPLTAEDSRRPESEETIVTPSTSGYAGRELPPTQYGQLPGKATVQASQGQIPPMYRPTPKPRSAWPWVVGGLALLFLLGIVIAAVVAIPMMMKKTNNSNVVVTTETPSESPAETSTPRPAGSPAGSAARPAAEGVFC